jgi:hypothetical protein
MGSGADSRDSDTNTNDRETCGDADEGRNRRPRSGFRTLTRGTEERLANPACTQRWLIGNAKASGDTVSISTALLTKDGALRVSVIGLAAWASSFLLHAAGEQEEKQLGNVRCSEWEAAQNSGKEVKSDRQGMGA